MIIDHIKIPGVLFWDNRLQPQERNIYGLFLWFKEKTGEECKVANPVIAKILNGSKRSVANCISSLEKKGYIKREFQGVRNAGRRTIILLPLPENEMEILECFYCKKIDQTGEFLTEDHVIPTSRGGEDTQENTVLSCRPCNSKKHTQTATEFFGLE